MFGFRISRSVRKANPYALHGVLAAKQNPVVFDIGANVGQTLKSYRSAIPDAVIHSFEPYGPSFAVLAQVCSADHLSHAHQLAIGDRPGQVDLFVQEKSATNSLLPPAPSANSIWAGALQPRGKLKVSVMPLDGFCVSHDVWPDIIKIDTQGNELRVLRGAVETLKTALIVYLEIIVSEAYLGQATPAALFGTLYDSGFVLWSISECHSSKAGRLLYFDATFVKGELSNVNISDRGHEDNLQ